MIAIVTATARNDWPRARALMAGVRLNWPRPVQLFGYHDERERQSSVHGRVANLGELPDWLEFSTAHGKDPMATGRAAPHMGWPPKAVREGYYARTDAVAAARKVFAIRDAARRVGRGVLIWADPDAIAEKWVTFADIDRLMHRHDIVVHGGREHPVGATIAFWLPNCLPLIERWADHYARDEVFRYRDWHADATLKWTLERHQRLEVGSLSDQPQKDPWSCERALFQRPVELLPA